MIGRKLIFLKVMAMYYLGVLEFDRDDKKS